MVGCSGCEDAGQAFPAFGKEANTEGEHDHVFDSLSIYIERGATAVNPA